jgi:hypothetical protein
MLELTVSCSRERGRPSAQRHCGWCSQCLDRRFGTVAADLEDYDLAEQYGTDVFTHALPEGEARTVAVSWVRFAQRFAHLSDDEIFEEYPQLYECILETDPDPHETARSLCELLRRHAETTLSVIATMLARESHALSAGDLPETALLRLVVGVEPQVKLDAASASMIRKEGRYWTVAFRGRQVQLGGRTGPQYLAMLLQNPGRPIHVNELVSGGITDAPPTSGLGEGLDNERPLAYPLADEEAIKGYENSLRQLERYPAQGSAVQREMAQLQRAISEARGPSGRRRAFTDEGEKNRQSVSKALRRTLKDIATYHPELEKHLNRALNIGFTCKYDPDLPIQWET